MEVEKDYEEETSDFIPIDSVDLTGEDDEDDSEEQPSASPIASPQRQKQPKKTSITPDLSKHICYQLFSLPSLLIPGKIGNSYIVVIVFLSLYREESCTESGRTQGVGQCKLTNKNVVLSTVIAKLIVW